MIAMTDAIDTTDRYTATASTNILRERSTLMTWAILAVVTVITTWFLTSESLDYRWALIAIFALSAWKIRLVMTDFIELHDAPMSGRIIFEGWAVVVPIALAVLAWH